MVSLFENENDLEKEYYNSILIRYFPNIDIPKLENSFTENNEIQIFYLIDQLIEKECIFDKRELAIFKNGFYYYSNFRYKQLEEIGNNIGVTRERTRQIRNNIFEKLNSYFKFVKAFEIDFNSRYNINTDNDLIIIGDEVVKKINYKERNRFNKPFINKIISIFCNQTHSLIGREKDLVFNINRRSINKWKTTYLINNTLTKNFNFEKFADDVFNRLDNRISNSYSFNFKSYLLKFYNSKDYSQIEDITEVCEKLIFEEFGLVLDEEENIVFQRNVRKQIYEYAYEVLKKAQKPMNFEQIFRKVIEDNPNIEITRNTLRTSLKRSYGFIPYGKSGSFGLKDFENASHDLITMADIAFNFIEKEKRDVKISELVEYVRKYYPKTSKRSVIETLKNSKYNLTIRSTYVSLNLENFSSL